MDEHLSNREIDALLEEPDSPAARRALCHLLGGCENCASQLAEAALAEFGEITPTVEEISYDGVLERAWQKASGETTRWAEERRRFDRILEACARSGGMLQLSTEHPDRGTWAWVEVALKESFEARFRDRRRMLVLAFGARIAADLLDPAYYWPPLLNDLRARAWGELANAYRVNEDLRAAESSLARAEELRRAGTGDVLLLARLLDLEVSLRSDQRRLPEALETLDEIHQIYLSIGETHLAGRALLSKGINTFYDDRPAEAVLLLRQGLSLLDPGRDPRLEAIGRKDLIAALVDSGACGEASALLLEGGLRQAFAEDLLTLLRLRWLEGKIHVSSGRLGRAAKALEEAREGFLDHGVEYHAALVGLELAGVRLDLGESGEAIQLASSVLTTFERLGVKREALRAVHFLETACQEQEATGADARHVLAFVQRLEWHPHLRFAR